MLWYHLNGNVDGLLKPLLQLILSRRVSFLASAAVLSPIQCEASLLEGELTLEAAVAATETTLGLLGGGKTGRAKDMTRN